MWFAAFVAGALLVAVPGSERGLRQMAADGLLTAAPSIFVSPSGNDANRCIATSPCLSLNRAYRAATPGKVIQVAAGSYGAQTIDNDPRKNSAMADVVFRPAPGATARFSEVMISARHIVFAGTGSGKGFSFGGWTAASGASNIAFRDVSTQIFAILSASHISIIGGQVGPWDSNPSGEDPQIKAQSGTAPPPTDILISGVYFHDITKNVFPDYHTDCLQFGSGQHVVIVNNRFIRCSDTDLFVRSWGRGQADQLHDFVIEHNVFGPTTVQPGYVDLQLADSEVDGDYCDSFIFRYNVVLGRPLVFKCAPPVGRTGQGLLYGNVLPRVDSWTCAQNTTTGNQPKYSYNVYSEPTSARCDPSEAIGRPVFIVKPTTARTKRSLRLRYTLVAPAGTPVRLRIYRRRRVLSTLAEKAPTTPGVQSVSIPLSSRTTATRLCVTAGTPPNSTVSCAAIAKP